VLSDGIELTTAEESKLEALAAVTFDLMGLDSFVPPALPKRFVPTPE
jgi:hypothetical protein